MKNIVITGPPGIGKTSICQKVIESLKSKDFKVGGMLSSEVREKGSRVGFKILNISTNQEGWLAHINQKVGPQVSKYRVILEDIEKIGTKAIEKAIEEADVILIDELGPMELYCDSFKETAQRAFDSNKPVLATIHYRSTHPFIKNIKERKDVELILIDLENREKLPEEIFKKLLRNLKK
ncbi:MAG: NTPase [Euryarchaeota archaeon]|nr:NTPase [Euryarchaeota archaeon]